MCIAMCVYLIHNGVFDPQRKTIVRNGEEIILETKVGELLHLLCKNFGEVTSRKDITEQLWGCDWIDDNRFNNKIYELRKVFADNAKEQKVIKTFPRKGYELTHKPIEKNRNQAKIFTNRRKLFAVIFTAFMVSTISLFTIPKQNESTLPESKNIVWSKPLTYEKGQEWSGRISPTGKYLVYSNRSSQKGNWTIKLKRNSDNHIYDITTRNYSSLSPILNHKENIIYFNKSTDEYPCELWSANITNFEDIVFSKIANCGPYKSISPIELGHKEEWLYYVNFQNQQFFIERVHLSSLIKERLTLPAINGFGDYTFSLSSDGSKIAFLRSIVNSWTDLLVMDLQSRELTKLKTIKHRLGNISWSDDDNYIQYLSASANLNQISFDTRLESQLIRLNYPISSASQIDSKQFIVTRNEFYSNSIFITDNEGKTEKKQIVDSQFNDRFAVKIKEDVYIYISDRSGINQVWQYSGGQNTQLTHFKGNSYISDLRVNKNHTYITFIQNHELKLLSISPKPSHEIITIPAEQVSSLSWDYENNLLYTGIVNGLHSLYRYDVSKSSSELILTGISMVKTDRQTGRVYIKKQGQSALYQFNNENKSLDKVFDNITDVANLFEINNYSLYLIKGSKVVVSDLKTKNSSELKFTDQEIMAIRFFECDILWTIKSFNETSLEKIFIE